MNAPPSWGSPTKEKTVYFSRTTGLKVKDVSDTAQGSMISVYKEYVEVEGVKFPKVVSQTAGPQNFDVHFETIVVNGEGADAKIKI